MDGTHIKIKGGWAYLYRGRQVRRHRRFHAVGHRDQAAATAFLKPAIDGNGPPFVNNC
ncbi:MAG: IS6 family transposase, partial [Methylobacter sp.]